MPIEVRYGPDMELVAQAAGVIGYGEQARQDQARWAQMAQSYDLRRTREKQQAFENQLATSRALVDARDKAERLAHAQAQLASQEERAEENLDLRRQLGMTPEQREEYMRAKQMATGERQMQLAGVQAGYREADLTAKQRVQLDKLNNAISEVQRMQAAGELSQAEANRMVLQLHGAAAGLRVGQIPVRPQTIQDVLAQRGMFRGDYGLAAVMQPGGKVDIQRMPQGAPAMAAGGGARGGTRGAGGAPSLNELYGLGPQLSPQQVAKVQDAALDHFKSTGETATPKALAAKVAELAQALDPANLEPKTGTPEWDQWKLLRDAKTAQARDFVARARVFLREQQAETEARESWEARPEVRAERLRDEMDEMAKALGEAQARAADGDRQAKYDVHRLGLRMQGLRQAHAVAQEALAPSPLMPATLAALSRQAAQMAKDPGAVKAATLRTVTPEVRKRVEQLEAASQSAKPGSPAQRRLQREQEELLIGAQKRLLAGEPADVEPSRQQLLDEASRLDEAARTERHGGRRLNMTNTAIRLRIAAETARDDPSWRPAPARPYKAREVMRGILAD